MVPVILTCFALAYAFAFWTGWRSAKADVVAHRTRIRALVIFAVAAPLVGAVAGLIQVFRGVAAVDPSEKASLMAAGIAEAMNCFALFVFLDLGLIGFVVTGWYARALYSKAAG